MIVFYVFHAGTARIMKLLCVRIENICDFRSLRCLRSASVNTRCGCLCAFLYAFTCCIIDHDSWLDIERKHIKAQCASVLHRICFHLYPRSYQIIPGINRCATINHMIFCARNVVRYLRFKYNHAACIQISRPGKQVFRSCIVTTQHERDHMRAVVQIPVLSKIIILRCLPAGRISVSHASPCLCRKRFRS